MGWFFIQKENMDTIQIANILLTRRCNLRCDYCSIVRDYKDMPIEYPRMEYYKNTELSVDQWIEIIDRLANNNPNIFLIFYGGEPFLYPGLTDLIKYCHSKNLYYTIISNNTEEIQPKILDLYKEVGTIRGFSASIDPNLYEMITTDKVERNHESLKTIKGYHNLLDLKRNGIADDVVAEITVTNDNYKYLYRTVKMLTLAGIYSSITTIDLKKSDFYDFSTITDESLLVQQTEGIAKQFMDIMADESLKVHIPQILIKLYDILPCEMKCKIPEKITNITVDSDGSIRLCLRIRGITTPGLKIPAVIFPDGEITTLFKMAMKKDYDSYCLGCNWTCAIMSDFFSNSVVVH